MAFGANDSLPSFSPAFFFPPFFFPAFSLPAFSLPAFSCTASFSPTSSSLASSSPASFSPASFSPASFSPASFSPASSMKGFLSCQNPSFLAWSYNEDRFLYVLPCLMELAFTFHIPLIYQSIDMSSSLSISSLAS